MIETWGFYIFGLPKGHGEPPAPDEYQQVIKRYLDLWVRCEEWGFDGLSWSEHHFNPATISPSPHLLVASVAAQTTKLRFTILGSVLPMTDARRYVEECGMLRFMTNGRFEPGIGPGAGVLDITKAGIDPEEARPRYRSGAEVLRKALTGKPVTHQDEFYNLDAVPIEPPVGPRPGESVWVTVLSPESAAWAAESGFKMCTAWSPTDVAVAVAGTYYEAADAAGLRVDPSMVGLRRRVFVADSDAEAQEKYEEAGDLVQYHAGKAFESVDPAVFSMLMHPDDFAIGSPDTVAERLIEQCRAGGFGRFVAFADFGGFTPEDLARSHELIGTKVAPILRSAEVRGGKRETATKGDEFSSAHATGIAHGRHVRAN